ncbi:MULTISPECIES: toxin-antitoxin system HicB family antitoxin [Clostridium]|uniref:toxin-antitoxin system HicB family antitoxin n=1 Tax=Clostridium TaxID=1485 RepID=UPI00325BAA92
MENEIKLLKDDRINWLKAAIEEKIEIHEPLNEEDFSGKIKLRLPKSLHKYLIEKSKAEGISMNQYCVYALSKTLVNK